MNYDKRLSIIVPVYNVEEYLERCVDSLLDQDLLHEEYEIILINDGSTDNSYEIAKRLAGEHDNIVLLTQENQGLSGARNTGLEHVRGKYIMFVDSDDTVEPQAVGQLIASMDGNQLDLCFFKILYDRNSYIEKGQSYGFSYDSIYDGEYLMLHKMDVSSVWRCAYNSDFLLGTGIRFTPGIYHEDVDFNYRLYPLAKRVMFYDNYLYRYRVYGESILRTANPIKLKKQIEGCFHAVTVIRKAILTDRYSEPIKRLYRRHTNSIVASMLLRLIKDHRVSLADRKDCLDLAKHLAVYPIKGRTNSWKTTLLIPFLNCEWLYRYLLR